MTGVVHPPYCHCSHTAFLVFTLRLKLPRRQRGTGEYGKCFFTLLPSLVHSKYFTDIFRSKLSLP